MFASSFAGVRSHGVRRGRDDLADAHLQPLGQIESRECDLIGVGGASVVAHVPHVVQPLEADVGEKADLAGSLEEILVADLLEVILGLQRLAQLAGSDRDVEKIAEVEARDPLAKLVDEFVQR